MDIEEFRRELDDEVKLHLQETGVGLSAGFAEKIVAMLIDAEYFNGDFHESFFKGLHPKRRSYLQIDGYLIDDADDSINLFAVYYVTDDSNLTKTQADTSLKMLAAFLDAVIDTDLIEDIEPSLPIYELVEHIRNTVRDNLKYRFILLTNARRSLTLNELKEFPLRGLIADCQVWDIDRIFDIYNSMQVREEIEIDFTRYGDGIPCLRADAAVNASYESFLCVIPGDVLVDIYDRYGSRLLENNVRAFLSTRVKVNKAIRATILGEPSMFFAFNNGIAVTVKDITFKDTPRGRFITSAIDFQIINGGQTTASLSNAAFKDGASVENIFVPMKLTRIGNMSNEQQEALIRKISRTSNSQNKISEADFFATHPFHVELEKISRRISAPATSGLRQVYWFYERARGQYLQEQMRMSSSEKLKFNRLNPKEQVITKTDLARYRMSWAEQPYIVSAGTQPCFRAFAELINNTWDKAPEQFNEHYFRESISLAIMFKTVERLVRKQPWYKSNRTQIVAYSIALLHYSIKKKFPKTELDLLKIWRMQCLPERLVRLLEGIAEQVNAVILNVVREGDYNAQQWCKQQICWAKMIQAVSIGLPANLSELMLDAQELQSRRRAAEDAQRIALELEMQKKIVSLSGNQWKKLFIEALQRKLSLSSNEMTALNAAAKLPSKVPNPKQCELLIQLLDRLKSEGVPLPSS